MSDEFVEYMEDSFGVRMDMDGLRIGNEHSGDSENKRTAHLQKLQCVKILFSFNAESFPTLLTSPKFLSRRNKPDY
ncbi:Hypothetical predicted protein [Octopus vulgaris]|uniref:Uncharacterized protein n=1 Tax=Octopus vulgaris TaxID=6645 RepID=A0AA36BIU5_OCTVU|nr:Hypothetical predicted protein [Octopus vulgaris]